MKPVMLLPENTCSFEISSWKPGFKLLRNLSKNQNAGQRHTKKVGWVPKQQSRDYIIYYDRYAIP